MKIVCLGGGFVGFYFVIFMKLCDVDCEIDVYECNKFGDMFGWGVVFFDQMMENFEGNDLISVLVIVNSLVYWDDIDVYFGGVVEMLIGYGFCGIGCKYLFNIFQDCVCELGVNLYFNVEIDLDLSVFFDVDIIIVFDGINLKICNIYVDVFKLDVEI